MGKTGTETKERSAYAERRERLRLLWEEARIPEPPEGLRYGWKPFSAGYLIDVYFPVTHGNQAEMTGGLDTVSGVVAWKTNTSDEEKMVAGEWAAAVYEALPYHDLMTIRRGAWRREYPGTLRYNIILKNVEDFIEDTDWYFIDRQ